MKKFLNNILDNATMLSLIVMSIGWLYIVIKNLNSPDIIILSLFGSILCLGMMLYTYSRCINMNRTLDAIALLIIFCVTVALTTITVLDITFNLIVS